MIKVIGVRFRGGGKVYYFDPQDLALIARLLSSPWAGLEPSLIQSS